MENNRTKLSVVISFHIIKKDFFLLLKVSLFHYILLLF